MNVLISIRQPYVNMIFAGKKMWEFRRRRPKERGNNFFVYECGEGSAHAIVGAFLSRGYNCVQDQDVPYYASGGGLSEESLRAYMPCTAILVSASWRYDTPVTLEDIGLTRPPQSWQHLTDQQVLAIVRKGRGAVQS